MFFILLTSLTAFAGNYFPVGKVGDNKTVYKSKDKCERVEEVVCYDITGKDLRYWEVGVVNVDDLTRPIYEVKTAVTPCDGEIECGDLNTVSYCVDNGQTADHIAIINESYTEIYCTRLVGYQQKGVTRLVENASNKTAADAEDAAKEAEKVSRKNKRDTRLTALVACAKASDYTNAQLKQCVRRLAKEIARLRLLESEL